MNKRLRFVFIALLLMVGIGVQTATAAPSRACTTGTQTSGALYQICMPDFTTWNGTLVLYAHGYVAPDAPLALPAEGAQLAAFANLQGYAFATTSYSRNGLAVREGIADLLDLIDLFTAAQSAPERVFLIGFSEGGIITTLAVEENPTTFAAGLSMCGPIGDFAAQVNYLGDARVLFDYFFPGLMPGSPINIPDTLQADWDNYFATTITPVLSDPANLATITTYLTVAGIPYDTADPTTAAASIAQVLWYNVFSVNDATAQLGGNPYDNQARVYAGSADDVALNAGVARFTADANALTLLNEQYRTSGQLAVPMVTMHTTADPVVPAWHNDIYADKVAANGSTANYAYTAIDVYGHCNFSQLEVVTAVNQMVALADAQPTAVTLTTGTAQAPTMHLLVALLVGTLGISTHFSTRKS